MCFIFYTSLGDTAITVECLINVPPLVNIISTVITSYKQPPLLLFTAVEINSLNAVFFV